jgi:hypothetical protein
MPGICWFGRFSGPSLWRRGCGGHGDNWAGRSGCVLTDPRHSEGLEDLPGNACKGKFTVNVDCLCGFWISPVSDQSPESSSLIVIFNLRCNHLRKTRCHGNI